MSGCAICVYDLYHVALTNYNEKMQLIRSNLSALDVPQSQWPKQLREGLLEVPKDPTLSAFEALEMKLKARHDAQSGV